MVAGSVAKVVEPISPLYYEDPLQPAFDDNWLTLRRTTRLPIMTGENLELAEQALPFVATQAVDCLQPDIVNSGGITGTRLIAEAAALAAKAPRGLLGALFDRWARAVDEASRLPTPRLLYEMAAIDLCAAEPMVPLFRCIRFMPE